MKLFLKSLAYACIECGLLYLAIVRRVDGAENLFIALQWFLVTVYSGGMVFAATDDKFLTGLASKPRFGPVTKWFFRAYNIVLLSTLIWYGWWVCSALAFTSTICGCVLSLGVNQKREKLAKEKAKTTGPGF